MFKDERFWLLVSLQLSGEATHDEIEELKMRLQQDPESYKQFMILADCLWEKKVENSTELKEEAYNKHLQRLSNHLAEPTLQYDTKAEPIEKLEAKKAKSKIMYRKLWWGGAVAASLLLCWIGFNKFGKDELSQAEFATNTISTKPGSKTAIKLPDGSKVWLNADSKITYGNNFNGKVREVTLSGEAFFDIVKDKTRPFIIHTRTIDLKVLGTVFNVRSYENEKKTETVLVHGSIEVTLRNNPDKKVVLKPSEKLVVKNNTEAEKSNQKASNVKSVDEEPLIVLSKMNYYGKDSSTSIETSWTKDRLAFDKERLEEIALKIERWYNVEVIIKDESLKDAKFTGMFENESLDEVMEALKLTGNFNYSIKKKQVIISR